jgi:hypothetical protein
MSENQEQGCSECHRIYVLLCGVLANPAFSHPDGRYCESCKNAKKKGEQNG